MKIISIIVLFFGMVVSCKDENRAQTPIINTDADSIKSVKKAEIIDSIKNQDIPKNPELLNYSKGCDCGKGNLTVNTEYYNIPDTINNYNYIITHQELVFNIDNKIIKKVIPPYKHIERMIYNQLYNVPVTDIYSVKCVQKNNEFIYSIYGGNIYDPPHEFFSFNNLEGEWLWYFYGDRYDTYKSFGDKNPYIERFGEQLNKLDDMTQVVPDWFLGY